MTNLKNIQILFASGGALAKVTIDQRNLQVCPFDVEQEMTFKRHIHASLAKHVKQSRYH